MEQRFLKNYKVCVSRSERASERASASVMQMGRVRKCGLCDFGRGERCR